MKRTEVVNQISKAIRKVAPTATAILYGSEARGDARSDSDIDVLILLDGDSRDLKHEDKLSGELYEIELETGVYIPEVSVDEQGNVKKLVPIRYKNRLKEVMNK